MSSTTCVRYPPYEIGFYVPSIIYAPRYLYFYIKFIILATQRDKWLLLKEYEILHFLCVCLFCRRRSIFFSSKAYDVETARKELDQLHIERTINFSWGEYKKNRKMWSKLYNWRNKYKMWSIEKMLRFYDLLGYKLSIGGHTNIIWMTTIQYWKCKCYNWNHRWQIIEHLCIVCGSDWCVRCKVLFN